MPKLCEHKQLLNTRPEASAPVRACVVSSPIFHPKCCHNEVIELVGSPARIHKIESSTSTIIEHHHRASCIDCSTYAVRTRMCVCVPYVLYHIFPAARPSSVYPRAQKYYISPERPEPSNAFTWRARRCRPCTGILCSTQPAPPTHGQDATRRRRHLQAQARPPPGCHPPHSSTNPEKAAHSAPHRVVEHRFICT